MALGEEIAAALGSLPSMRVELLPGDAIGVTWVEGGRARHVAARPATSW